MTRRKQPNNRTDSRPENRMARAVATRPWAVVVLAVALSLGQPQGAVAGGVTGAATEWTQLLNNAQLGKIAGLEGQILSKEAQSLVAQLEQLQTQIKSYRKHSPKAACCAV